jgi:hypothetical protein
LPESWKCFHNWAWSVLLLTGDLGLARARSDQALRLSAQGMGARLLSCVVALCNGEWRTCEATIPELAGIGGSTLLGSWEQFAARVRAASQTRPRKFKELHRGRFTGFYLEGATLQNIGAMSVDLTFSGGAVSAGRKRSSWPIYDTRPDRRISIYACEKVSWAALSAISRSYTTWRFTWALRYRLRISWPFHTLARI